MINYIPFLKSKINEFKALSALSPEISTNITPFIDLKRNSEDYDITTYNKLLKTTKTYIHNYLINYQSFYLDDLDLGDDLYINNRQSYESLIDNLKDINYHPVIGVERSDDRNKVVFENKEKIISSVVALRVSVIELLPRAKNIENLTNDALKYFSSVHLIIDCRIVPNEDIDKYSIAINKYLIKYSNLFTKIIVSGSSIPEQINEIADINSVTTIERNEIILFNKIDKNEKIFLGDYAIVTPKFVDPKIDPKIFPNIMAPKLIYSYNTKQIIFRGVVLRKGGYDQYKKFCKQLSFESFFRGEKYSNGDNFLANTDNYTKKITPSVILAPTINAHITYMYKDFQL